ncbi:MAG: helix-turn-helix domain-containing protein [Candidatus Bathyarchaeota archaeon]|nr:helix-turn-helix domain-containing protein [Candidatus Bathyarchaeota archaeon]
MSLPCEVAVKCLLPPVRAMIAKTLTTRYNLTQTEAAKRLGISQPAISLYERKMRGKAINLENDPEITKLIENLADALAKGDLPRKSFIQAFCEICKTIRSKGLLCQMHKTFDPAIDVEKCELCLLTNALKCT